MVRNERDYEALALNWCVRLFGAFRFFYCGARFNFYLHRLGVIKLIKGEYILVLNNKYLRILLNNMQELALSLLIPMYLNYRVQEQ